MRSHKRQNGLKQGGKNHGQVGISLDFTVSMARILKMLKNSAFGD